jgi:hypothetical protein
VRTDELIETLVVDARRSGKRPSMSWLTVAGLAIIAAALVFAVSIGGVRPDIAAAATDPRFLAKFAVTLSLAGAAFLVLRESAYPEGIRSRGLLVLLLPVVVLALAVGFELAATPRGAIVDRLLGENALACLAEVTLIGIAPLALFVLALRRAAPARPALSGLSAGLLAGAIAASAYATHCPDDSPLFVAAWYSLAIAGLGAAGALAARVVARW